MWEFEAKNINLEGDIWMRVEAGEHYLLFERIPEKQDAGSSPCWSWKNEW